MDWLTDPQIWIALITLTTLEIVLGIDNLVFMGMGEPLANYDNLIRALRIINAPWALGIGARVLPFDDVTEAALEVGYNSLSHFSAAFHETFGCCPGLYPLKLPGRKS